MFKPLHIWHPYTQEALDPEPVRIKRAEGVYLYTEDGRKLLDGISSWWVNIHGHAHPRISEAIAEQARQMEHVIFAGFTHEPAEQLSAKLRNITPEGLSHIFFSDNGSTAVEVALKMAVQYWRNRGEGQRKNIIALEHGLPWRHGGRDVGQRSFGLYRCFRRHALRSPARALCLLLPVSGRTQTDSCSIECLASIQALLEQHAGTVAAVIVEPLLQGAGGMIMHPPEFLRRISELCREHGVLLIADEVLTGFGRTGAMFACELAGVIPDIMCLSKGLTGGFLPFSATLCSEEIYSSFLAPDRMHTLFHGHSYAGNPLGCAAALASLEIFESEPVFDRIRTIERIHHERLPCWVRTHWWAILV